MVSSYGEHSWRWMTLSAAFPTVILLTLAMTACPESPRFLMGRNKYVDAFETFSRLRSSRILAAKELLFTHHQMGVEHRLARPPTPTLASALPEGQRTSQTIERRSSDASWRDDLARRPNFFQRLWQLFSVRRIRNALATAVVCMISQQLCGINVLIFYSSSIFHNAEGNACDTDPRTLLRPLFMSWGLGLTNFLFAFPAYGLIDRFGRRWLLTTTMPFLCLLMAAAALSYIDSQNAVLAVFSYLFVAVYSWGLGVVPFTISAEVFPLDHRVVGM